MIRFGFACKTIGVPHAAQTSLTLARADPANLLGASRHNLYALENILRYCRETHIPLLRISSDMIPLASHPQVSFDWQRRLQTELESIAALLRNSGVRVSMHPGQYTVLNSPRPEVVEHALHDLSFHADFLEAVGTDKTARIILHLGGGYGDKRLALDRLKENLHALPSRIRDRLALENDERLYTIEDVLEICDQFRLPTVFDVFHHALNPPSRLSMEYWLDKAAATWDSKSGRQKIHYSQQLPGGKPGSHSRTIRMGEFLAFHERLRDRELDIMLEVKDKNLSTLKCANLLLPNLPRTRLTDEWARYKYLILERDPAAYIEIRRLLKAKNPTAGDFYALVEHALDKEITPGHARNAAQHIWGYLDKQASPAEEKRILSDIRALEKNVAVLPRLKRRLFALAEKHTAGYLLHSLYFYV